MVEDGFIKKGKSLDLCVGTGKNAFSLVKKGFEVTGIDIWLKSIEYWHEHTKQEPDFVPSNQYQFLSLPFEKNTFDFVYDLGCFHHILKIDRDSYIAEVHRVLKKGGLYLLAILSDENGPAWNHFSKEDIENTFLTLYEFKLIQHNSFIESNCDSLFFYTFLMEKK